MSDHTKGKWEIYGDFKKGYWVQGEDGRNICCLSSLGNTFSLNTTEANARLIAQAPIMAELLEDILSCQDYGDIDSRKIELVLQEINGGSIRKSGTILTLIDGE